jgi:hypothetical protein
MLAPNAARAAAALATRSPREAIIATLTGSDRCEALGVVATGYAPVLTLCRSLIAAGVSPDTALTVCRRGVVALNGTPRFRLARSERCGAASPVRQNDFSDQANVARLARRSRR